MMRTRLISMSVVAAVMLGAAALCVPRPAVADDQGYPLVCRGGKYLVHYSYSGGSAELTMQMSSTGTQGVSGKYGALEPGQCSWLDRGFRPGESNMLCAKPAQFTMNGATSADGAIVNLQSDQPAIDFDRLADASKYTTFQVHKSDTCFQITFSAPSSEPFVFPPPQMPAPSSPPHRAS